MVGSLESEVVVVLCDSGDAVNELVKFCTAGFSDSSVEFSMSGFIIFGELCSLEDCST